MSRPSPRLVHALCLGILALAIVVAFSSVVGSDRALLFRDHSASTRPRLWFALEELRGLRLPTLTRAHSSGIPLEVSLTPWYTPPAGVLFLGDFDTVYDWFVIAHFFLFAAGVYVLALALGAAPLEAVAAASVASLSGPIVSLENLVPLLYGLAYAPWVFWAFLRLLSSQSALNIGVLALAFGFHIQTPHPHLVAIDVLALIFILGYVRPRIHLRLAASAV